MQAQARIRPEANEFGGRPANYIPAEEIDRSMTRCIWSPLDVVGAARKQQVYWLRHGGEELKVATNRLFNGLLPKCVFVPLQKSAEFLPTNRGLANAEIMKSPVVHDAQGIADREGLPRYAREPLTGFAAYPGYDIVTMQRMNEDQGQRRGMKEIVEMRGVDWDPVLWPALQAHFFPNWSVPANDWNPLEPRVPVELRLVEGLINDGITQYRQGARVGDLDLQAIASTMLGGCQEYRNWAVQRIRIENAIIESEKTDPQYRSYSDLALTLLPQMEMEAVDQHLQNQKRQTDQNSANMGQLVSVMTQFVNALAVERKAPISEDEIMEMVNQKLKVKTVADDPADRS